MSTNKKITEAITFIKKLANEANAVDYYQRNAKLTDEVNDLESENDRLKTRIKQLTKDNIRPFDMSSFDPEVTIHELEKQYILNAVKYFNGNKTKASEALDIGIKNLYNKLHEYGELE